MTEHSDGASRVRPGARRAGWSMAAALLGAALLTATGVAACQAQPPKDVGAATVSALASAQPGPVTTTDSAAPSFPVRDGTLPRPDDIVIPARLSIPAMKLDATVTPVGVDAKTGDFDVPPSVDRVGWYRFGPGLEATTGSVVIAGHVDSAAQGKGAFFALERLAPGDELTVTGRDGKTYGYRVVGRERFEKTKIPLQRYFALTGAPRLTLITCGGPFDAATGHYRDNVVVTAEPVPAK